MPTKRGSSWQGTVYHVSLPGGRARRNFPNNVAAQMWELESKAKLMRGEPIDMGEDEAGSRKEGVPYTLGELVEHVGRTRWAGTASGQDQLANARMMVALIGSALPITKVNKAHIDIARGKLQARGMALPTVNRKVAALSTCFTQAHHMEIVDRKPIFEKYREHEGRIRRFTPQEEVQAIDFFERAGLPDMADYVALSVDTGLRQGELLGLRHRDGDGVKITVWGTGAKSGRTRSVPLTGRAKGILARRLGEPAELVLAALDKGIIHRRWEQLSQRMGLAEDAQFVPHTMRHEFCSRLADRGLNAAVIKELAGHSSLAVTQKYIHVGAHALVAAIAALEGRPQLVAA